MLDPQQQDQQKRQQLAIALIFVIVMGYMAYEANRQAKLPRAGAPDGGTTAVAQAPVAPPPSGLTVDGALPAATPPPATADALPARELEVQRPEALFRFSTEGGGVVFAELQGQKLRVQERTGLVEGYKRIFGGATTERPQVNLAVPVDGRAVPLAVGITGQNPFPAATRYRVEEQSASKLVLVATTPGWEVTRTYEWPPERTWEVRQTIALRNLSGSTATGELTTQMSRQVDPTQEEEPSMLQGTLGNQAQVVCGVGEDFHKLGPESKPETFTGPVFFTGVDQQYFLSAIFPLDAARQGACVLEPLSTARTAAARFPISVEAGKTETIRLGLYMGPKEADALKAAHARLSDALHSPRLESTEDYGILEVLCRLLIWIMKAFYSVIHNWGVAIILLTVVVKLLLFPLQYKSMAAMEQLKKLQPKLEAIKAKHKDDREKQQMETLKVYQEAKVNPLGGCLPLLIQLPVWAALFQALRSSYDIYNEPFITPVWTDLTYKDPTYVLPVALGVTMIITQRLQPQAMMDKTQAFVLTWVMPIFFTLIMLNYPAGLSLYIFTNNILSIAQTYGLRSYLERKGALTPATAVSGGARK